MKRTAILLSVVLVAFCLACGLQAQERKDFNSWRDGMASCVGGQEARRSTVLSGCELKIDGIPMPFIRDTDIEKTRTLRHSLSVG